LNLGLPPSTGSVIPARPANQKIKKKKSASEIDSAPKKPNNS
jgi:hypothetical protein